CKKVERNFYIKCGITTALGRYLKSSEKLAEDDEAKIDELKILATLNSLRRSAKCCVASLKLIREENLIRTVLRQDRTLRKLRNKLSETERKLDVLAAEYFAQRAFLPSENSECDSGCNTERSPSPNSSTSRGAINRKKAAYAMHEECACGEREARFAPADGARIEGRTMEELNRVALPSMSVCSPTTSVVLHDSDECRGDATSGPLSSLADKCTTHFTCCSVTLQKSNLPNNTERYERDALRSKLTFDALQPQYKQRVLAKPLCRRECVTIDVDVCRSGSMKAVCWTPKQKLSAMLYVQTPVSHRKSVHLQRLQLCTDVAFDDHIHLEYKRLKTKRIVEYKIPLLL
uniref:Uncharacterized protein n=1 Tax=Parascaris univalens TaxID=6257 RepID=A0A915C2U8_PARUN